MAAIITTIGTSTNGYIVELDGSCVLIDCPVECEPQIIAEAKPQAILHTHIQAEHCGEWRLDQVIPVYVPKGSEEIAAISARFTADTITRFAEDRDWSDLGEEPYGIAGCITARPPGSPLNTAGILEPESVFRLGRINLEVIAFPGHGKESIGLYLRDEGILFSGDLICRGGFLPNLYDIERSYGGSGGYPDLKQSLLKVLDMTPVRLMPSQGPVITDPKGDIEALLSRLDWISQPAAIRSDRAEAQISSKPLRNLSHYREMVPGLFQAQLYGNTIIFIDESGEGLVIDPGPCLWGTWDDDCRRFREGIRELESEAGLKRITAILATHSHGDHVQLADVLREMYDAPFITTPDVAALLERPREYGYPCSLDWYAFPYLSIRVDRQIDYGKMFVWAGIDIKPIRTPGHCWAHTGFALEWRGSKVFCTGDALMYGDGPFNIPIPILYNDTAWPDRGVGVTIDIIEHMSPDILVGGHGHFCMVDKDLISDMKQAYRFSFEKVLDMVAPFGLINTMTPPGYDEKRDKIEGKKG